MLFATPGAAAGLTLKDAHGVLSDGGRFAGTVRVSRFNLQRVGDGRVLVVEGVLNGIATLADGTTRELRETFQTTAAVSRVGPTLPRAACQILDLDIGAIHLDLLGLVVDLSPIHLDIIAIPGGGLLGDLLCALANLLDGIPLFDVIERLLRRINLLLAAL